MSHDGGEHDDNRHVLVVHNESVASRRLADDVERSLGRLEHHFLRVDLSRMPGNDDLADQQNPWITTVLDNFRPSAVVHCGAESGEHDDLNRFPAVHVTDTPARRGPAALHVPEGMDLCDIDAMIADALVSIGLPSATGDGAGRLRTIVVSGYFGAGNRGDDIIVSTLLEALEQVPQTRVVLASPLPDEAVAAYGRTTFDRLDARECERWASIASLVILGPGGLWDDYSINSVGGLSGVVTGATRSPAHLVQLILLVRGFGGAFRGVGLGAGPLRDDASRAAVRLSMTLADGISVRDRESRALLAEISPELAERVEVIPDLAWAAEVLPATRATEPSWLPQDGPWLALNLRVWEDGTGQARVWQEVCEVASSRGLAIVCVPMQQQDADLMRTLPVPDGVPVHHMPVSTGHQQFLATLAGARALVAMRLHAGLLGHAVGTPGVGIAYHPKVSSHYLDIGREEFLVPMPVPQGHTQQLLLRALDEGLHAEHTACVEDRRHKAQAHLERLLVEITRLPAHPTGQAWNVLPSKASAPATIEVPGQVVRIQGDEAMGFNLVNDDRQVPVTYRDLGGTGCVMAMSNRVLGAGDCVNVDVDVPTKKDTGYRILIALKPALRETEALANTILHEVLVAERVVMSMDPARWNAPTSVVIAGVAVTDLTTVSIRTRALRDTQDWGWGAASALTIQALSVLPWNSGETVATASNPFATIWPEA